MEVNNTVDTVTETSEVKLKQEETIKLCPDKNVTFEETTDPITDDETKCSVSESNSGSFCSINVDDITEDDVNDIVRAIGSGNDENFEVTNLDIDHNNEKNNIDYTKFDFMLDLDVIDEYDGNRDGEKIKSLRKQNKTNLEHENMEQIKTTVNTDTECKQSTPIKNENVDKKQEKKQIKKEKKRKSSPNKIVSRRDPEKTRLAIEQDKIKSAKDKEKRLISDIVETGLVPPGMELEQGIDNLSEDNKNKSSKSKKSDRENDSKPSISEIRKSKSHDLNLDVSHKKRHLSEDETDILHERSSLTRKISRREKIIYDLSPELNRSIVMSPKRVSRKRSPLRRSREILISPRRNLRSPRRNLRRSPRRNPRISPRRSPRRSPIYSRRSRSRSLTLRRLNRSDKYSPSRRDRLYDLYKSRSPKARREEKIPFLQELAAKLNEVQPKTITCFNSNSFPYGVQDMYHQQPVFMPSPAPVPAPPPPPPQPPSGPVFYQQMVMLQQEMPHIMHPQQLEQQPLPPPAPQLIDYCPPAPPIHPPIQQFDPYDQSFFIGNPMSPIKEVHGKLKRNNIINIDTTLTDGLLRTTNTALQSPVNKFPASQLNGKWKVIRRCEDALNILNKRNYSGPLITCNDKVQEPVADKNTSPLLSKPAVNLPFITFGMNLSKDTNFSSNCNTLLNRIGLESISKLSSSVENLHVDDRLISSSESIIKKLDSPSIKSVTYETVETQTDTELSICKECLRRKSILYADCGVQAANVTLSFSIGTQVTESEFYSVIPRNQSLASLTPAQLLGKPMRTVDSIPTPDRQFELNSSNRNRGMIDQGYVSHYNNAPPYMDNFRQRDDYPPYPQPSILNHNYSYNDSYPYDDYFAARRGNYANRF